MLSTYWRGQFGELTEGGVGKLHPFSIQNWTKILISASQIPIFPQKNTQKLHQNSHFSSKNFHFFTNIIFSNKTGPKHGFFHQDWTKTCKFPPKLNHLSIKTLAKMIEKHGKTYENTRKIVKIGSTRNYIIKFPWFIHGFSFCCTDHPACQTMKILAGKRLEPAANQNCKKPTVAVCWRVQNCQYRWSCSGDRGAQCIDQIGFQHRGLHAVRSWTLAVIFVGCDCDVMFEKKQKWGER